MSNFLHNHLYWERTANLDPNHVIVDKDDWDGAIKLLSAFGSNKDEIIFNFTKFMKIRNYGIDPIQPWPRSFKVTITEVGPEGMCKIEGQPTSEEKIRDLYKSEE